MFNEILERLSGQYYQTFDAKHPGDLNLSKGQRSIIIYNPHHMEDLRILEDGPTLSLSFGEWNGTYQNDQEGFDLLMRDIENIMNDDSYVWSVKTRGEVVVGLVNDENSLFMQMAENGFSYYDPSGNARKIDLSKLEQEFLFWNPQAIDPTPSLLQS